MKNENMIFRFILIIHLVMKNFIEFEMLMQKRTIEKCRKEILKDNRILST